MGQQWTFKNFSVVTSHLVGSKRFYEQVERKVDISKCCKPIKNSCISFQTRSV